MAKNPLKTKDMVVVDLELRSSTELDGLLGLDVFHLQTLPQGVGLFDSVVQSALHSKLTNHADVDRLHVRSAVRSFEQKVLELV